MASTSNSSKRKRKLPNWMVGRGTKLRTTSETEAQASSNRAENSKELLDLPLLEYEGSIIYSYDPNDCAILCQDIMETLDDDTNLVCGFDLEWPVSFKSGKSAKVALVQLCTSLDKCYLFHISHMQGLPNTLKALLCDERIKKAGVGIESDFWKLERDFDVPAMPLIRRSMLDLSALAVAALNTSQRTWSLDGLAQHVLGRRLSKEAAVRTGDWSRYPLSDRQRRYAATDAYAGLLIYNELERRKRSP